MAKKLNKEELENLGENISENEPITEVKTPESPKVQISLSEYCAMTGQRFTTAIMKSRCRKTGTNPNSKLTIVEWEQIHLNN